jgi:hypothetical protein
MELEIPSHTELSAFEDNIFRIFMNQNILELQSSN